jgi:hypothetical protein
MSDKETPIHGPAVDGSGMLNCCGRTPFEIPRDERITLDPDAVTCRARRIDVAECTEDMGSDPCGGRAVGIRIDPTWGGEYPVCKAHLRPPFPGDVLEDES